MVFSLRQLQEKSVEQSRPLYVVFIDLTKAFDTVSRSGLYNILKLLGCAETLLSILVAFRKNMKARVQFDGSVSKTFPICRGVKQGCVLAPTLLDIFFQLFLPTLSQRRMEPCSALVALDDEFNQRISKTSSDLDLGFGKTTISPPNQRSGFTPLATCVFCYTAIRRGAHAAAKKAGSMHFNVLWGSFLKLKRMVE